MFSRAGCREPQTRARRIKVRLIPKLAVEDAERKAQMRRRPARQPVLQPQLLQVKANTNGKRNQKKVRLRPARNSPALPILKSWEVDAAAPTPKTFGSSAASLPWQDRQPL